MKLTGMGRERGSRDTLFRQLGRRRSYPVLLMIVVLMVVAMSLPVTMMLAVSTDPCKRANPQPSFLQSVNPFSAVTLCRIHRGMMSTNAQIPIPANSPTTYSSQPSSLQGLQPVSGRPSDEQRQAQENAHKQAQEVQRQAEAHARARHEEAERKRAAVAARVVEEQEWLEQQRREQAARVHGATVSAPVDDAELPESEEDYQRILRYPHYDSCNLCKVCVPLSAVEHHPLAKQYLSKLPSRATLRADDDVSIEVTEDPDLAHDPAEDGPRRALHGAGTRQPQLSRQGWVSVPGQQQRHSGRRLQSSNPADSEADSVYRVQGKEIDISDIAPGDTKRGPRAALPNCTVCWGCTHTLEMMASGAVMSGSYYSHEPGGSPSWLFRVRSPRTRSGWAVVKTWCVPVRKVKQRGLAMCSPRKVYAQVKLLLAQQKVVHECGFNSVVPSLWVEPVRGVIPGHGFRIDWLGLWAEVADGLSVQNIQEAGNPPTPPDVLLDLLTQRVNHSEVALLALFDLMFTQCDRHQQNIFLTEHGKLFAIDNDQVPGTAWRSCGVDSMVLPTTQKFMINHLGFFYTMKYPHKDPPKVPQAHLNPLLLLDYRCHVPGRALGFDYPGPLKACLRRLSSLSSQQLQTQYGYPSLTMASAMRNRSADLLSHGFEWTLKHGYPRNQAMHRYKVAPPCCNMTYTMKGSRTLFTCSDPEFKQMSELPYGNPWHGGAWHVGDAPDPGTYNGSTVFDAELM